LNPPSAVMVDAVEPVTPNGLESTEKDVTAVLGTSSHIVEAARTSGCSAAERIAAVDATPARNRLESR
jgi:hypothetical protein